MHRAQLGVACLLAFYCQCKGHLLPATVSGPLCSMAVVTRMKSCHGLPHHTHTHINECASPQPALGLTGSGRGGGVLGYARLFLNLRKSGCLQAPLCSALSVKLSLRAK